MSGSSCLLAVAQLSRMGTLTCGHMVPNNYDRRRQATEPLFVGMLAVS